MKLMDFIRGKTRKTIKPCYSVGDKVKVISFAIKRHDGFLYLNPDELAEYFRKRSIRCSDVVIGVFYIEVIEQTIFSEQGEVHYLARLEGDDILPISYINRFSYLDDIKKIHYWYPTGLDGYYLDYNYVVKCLPLISGIPKKMIGVVKAA